PHINDNWCFAFVQALFQFIGSNVSCYHDFVSIIFFTIIPLPVSICTVYRPFLRWRKDTGLPAAPATWLCTCRPMMSYTLIRLYKPSIYTSPAVGLGYRKYGSAAISSATLSASPVITGRIITAPAVVVSLTQ